MYNGDHVDKSTRVSLLRSDAINENRKKMLELDQLINKLIELEIY